MNKVTTYASVGMVSLLAASCLSQSKKEKDPIRPPEEKPNIVILFADDLGYGDLGVYGHPTIKTPHLDEMAEEGMKFTQFYVAATVSTPSRGALMTGRLPVRTGIHSGVYFPDTELGIPQEERTIAEALGEAGYATACYGKWHLGHKTKYLPTNHGFDEYFGIPYSNDMTPVYNDWSRAQTFPKIPLIEDTTVIERGPDQGLLTKRYTEHAVDFIKDHQSESFFLYLPYTFPHIPLFASETFQDTSKRGLYGDVVQEIDWSVGKILKTIKKQGIAKNTFVFFTSDNGPWLSEDIEGGSAGLLRGGKGTCWEGGMREPAIAWWPGTIKKGQVTTALASSMDLFTTSLKLGEAQLPGDRKIDGKDLTPLLKGKDKKIRNTLFYYRGDELYAVRKGPWKAHFITVENRYEPNQKVTHHDTPLLFNVEEDPSEKYNIAGQHPDILKELKALAEEHQKELEIKPSIIK
jgi:arylsulfatase A-like enzyme